MTRPGAFAKVMREHTLEATGGLTYSQMGRFRAVREPVRPEGHERHGSRREGLERPAGREQRPRHLGDGDGSDQRAQHGATWLQQLSVFGIVVGVALLLTGIGLLILALAVLGGRFREEAAAQAGVATKVAIGR